MTKRNATVQPIITPITTELSSETGAATTSVVVLDELSLLNVTRVLNSPNAVAPVVIDSITTPVVLAVVLASADIVVA